MRPGIAFVALPCLGEKSLSRTVADKLFQSTTNDFLSQGSLTQNVAVFRPGDHE
jgi:hypothetical protein